MNLANHDNPIFALLLIAIFNKIVIIKRIWLITLAVDALFYGLLTQQLAEKITHETGVESSLGGGDMKEYVKEVLMEVHSGKA